ncbi:UNVERIFIED_CONTAM: alpha/beta hydrolase, partial [Raoultella ornithinolytica]
MTDIPIEETTVETPQGCLFAKRWRGGLAQHAAGASKANVPEPAAPEPAAPIVLLHDSLGCVDLWRDFPAQLARATQRDVIAYDRLGFGRS